jgi:hypothetical protein
MSYQRGEPHSAKELLQRFISFTCNGIPGITHSKILEAPLEQAVIADDRCFSDSGLLAPFETVTNTIFNSQSAWAIVFCLVTALPAYLKLDLHV